MRLTAQYFYIYTQRETHCAEQCYFLWAGEGKLSLQVVTGANIAEKAANSNNPWIYLALILIIAALFAGRYIFNYLIKLDQSHRDESKEREKSLMQHLERSNDSQERTAQALEGINTNLSNLEGRVDRIEKHTYKESV